MSRTRVILTLLFVLTLSSGLVAGMLVTRLPATTGPQETGKPRTPFAEALQLTDEQNDKMRQIWERVRDNVDQCFIDAQEVQKRRDQELMELLTADQKAKFARIQKDSSAALAKLKLDRDGMFQKAVAETKQILTESQQKRYDEILQTRLGRGAGGGPPDWLSPQGPASMPSLPQ